LELTDIEELSMAIDFLYPAMLGIEAARRARRLQITALRETLNRQTGMYAVTKKISNEAANRVVAECCRSGDSCLKIILWTLEPGLPITSLPSAKFDPSADQLAEANAHSFPLLCHEACNLLVAAARKEVKEP
jgi:hypothetical protein